MSIADVRAPSGPARAHAHTADLTVVGGAGHVGVPLVLSFAATGLKVNVNDINAANLATLEAGRLPFIEHGAQALLTQALADKRLIFTSKPSEISTSGPVIVTIGTPVDEFLNPERRVIQNCIDGLLPHLRDGQLLVLRSTLYPGTTDWVDAYLLRTAAAQGRVLSRAGRAGFRRQGTAQDAADRQRHHARGRGGGSGAVPSDRARNGDCVSRSRRNSPSCSTTPIATSNSR